MEAQKLRKNVLKFTTSLDSVPQDYSPLLMELDCLSNYVYCIGGYTLDLIGNCVISSKVLRADVNDQLLKWTEVSRLNQKRSCMGATVYQNKLAVAGGYAGEDILGSVEFYHCGLNEWKVGPSLLQTRSA